MKTMTFKKTLVAASLAALSMAAVAQTNDAGKDEKELASTSDFAATANVMLASSYRFVVSTRLLTSLLFRVALISLCLTAFTWVTGTPT